MRFVKFLFYFLALDIGMTIAYCAYDQYDPTPNYSLVEPVKYRVSAESQATPVKTGGEWSDQARIGKKLFKTNCASCHNKNMMDDMTGPALAGTNERWEGREDLLYEWIRNSQAIIASGDPYAVALFREWTPTQMNAFPNLENEEIEAILVYIEEASS